MAKKSFHTDYILPAEALAEVATGSAPAAGAWAGTQLLKDFIAHPELAQVDGNPLQGGILPFVMAFDKPLHMTSFQLVARVRWMLTRALKGQKIKVGHAGTLDPLATGVMVMCTGRATKLIDQLQAGVKEYEATIRLGATTPSFDLEHPVDRTYPTEHITEEEVRRVLDTFVGEIMQVPPAYSACKVEGQRAYDLARSGQAEQVELKAKPLRIDAIELTECHLDRNEISIRVVCSKGTYIRALARDIGEALHSGAHLTALRRTRVGDFSLPRTFTVESFAEEMGGCVPQPQMEVKPLDAASKAAAAAQTEA